MKPKEFGQVTNTVKTVLNDGPNKGQVSTLQLPSLITPTSLFGKRIRQVTIKKKIFLQVKFHTLKGSADILF